LDTLTHALSGALLARAIAPATRQPEAPPNWQRITLCAVAAAFPDSDIIVNLFSPYHYLIHHRGATHSLLLWPLWALLLAGLAAWAFRRPNAWRTYAGVAALGILAHIAGDLITSYGTMIWTPFSDARVAWGTTFIIDLWFSGIILAGLFASIAWKQSRVPAVMACIALLGYLGLQAHWRAQAIDVGEQHAREAGISGATVTVQPGPVLPTNWMVVVEKEGHYQHAYVNLTRREILAEPGPEGAFIARLNAPFNPRDLAIWHKSALYGMGSDDEPFAREAWARPEFQFFHWFAQYPVLLRVEREAGSRCAWFQDQRFVREGSAFNPFRFGMCQDAKGTWTRHRMVGDKGREAF
jgi:inner membrane protein